MDHGRAVGRPVDDAASKMERAAFNVREGDAGAAELTAAFANEREVKPAHDHRHGFGGRRNLLPNLRLGAVAGKDLVYPVAGLWAGSLGDDDHWRANWSAETNRARANDVAALSGGVPKQLRERLPKG